MDVKNFNKQKKSKSDKTGESLELTSEHLRELEKSGILAIYLFGSRARGKSDASSDFDLGVVFSDPFARKNDTLEIYNRLYKIFTEALPEEYLKRRFRKGKHEFDVVFLQFAFISFQYKALKEDEVIYEKDRRQRLDYEEYVMKRYCDLAFLRKRYQRSVLNRIK
jgi:predicted nucleotidyltransferase